MTSPDLFLEDLPVPLLLSPDDHTVLWSNDAVRNLLGASARNLSGRAIVDILADVPNLAARLASLDVASAGFVLRDVRVLGRAHDVMIYPTGFRVGVLMQASSTSTVPPRASQSIEAMGQMIGHELKNPLAGIKGAAQLLKVDVSSKESLSLLDLIISEIDRIKRLSERLEYFGEGTGESEKVNVHTLLRNARKVVAPGATDVLFSEDYDPSLPHVDGDADLLMQALVNLIKNAVEALDEGGEITLRTRSRAGARREGRLLPIEIQVCDNGPGLPPHMQDRVFDPFVTSKPSGQGLGLALVAKITEQHGGIVEVASRAGDTRFSILLPATQTGTSHGT